MRAGVAAATLLVYSGAGAADLAGLPAARPGYDWSGFYIGGHVGFAAAGSDFTATQPGGADITGTLDLFRRYDLFTGEGSNFAGFQARHNTVFRSGLLLGLEADISFPGNMSGLSTLATPSIGAATYGDLVEMSGSVRARIGYAFGRWLYYGTAGYAWTADRLTRTQLSDNPAGASGGTVEIKLPTRSGWTLGAGVEAPLVPHWTARLEYLYSGFGTASVTFPLAGQRFDSNLSVQEVRLGLNYQLGGNGSNAGKEGLAPLEGDNWSVHGQTTYVSQYAPSFRAPYRGANSLDSNAGRETWDATLYAGLKLWPGAELWINPEIDQGFGLSATLGLAGFPSGEAYKLGSDDPYARVPRYFIRQTIDFGAATEKVDADINQFAGKQSPDRLVLTVGKFSVSDVFDTVKYAHGPRSDFLNWTLVDAGTFDYAADAWGYTYGASADLGVARRPVRSLGRAQQHRTRSLSTRSGDRRHAYHAGGSTLREPHRLQSQFRTADRRERRLLRPVRLGGRQLRAIRVHRRRPHGVAGHCACREAMGKARRQRRPCRHRQRHFEPAHRLSQRRGTGDPGGRRAAATSR